MKTCSRRRRSRDPINVAAEFKRRGIVHQAGHDGPLNGMPQVASGGVIAGHNGADKAVDMSANCGGSVAVEILGEYDVPLAFQFL